MAASDGIRQYWTILLARPDLINFTYLDAQGVWQKYFADLGVVKFHGKTSYIAFMQALMMAGVKGTALIGILGELYSAAGNPSATAKSVITAAAKASISKYARYLEEMKALKQAEISDAWLKSARRSCRFIIEHMKNEMEVAPSDIG